MQEEALAEQETPTFLEALGKQGLGCLGCLGFRGEWGEWGASFRVYGPPMVPKGDHAACPQYFNLKTTTLNPKPFLRHWRVFPPLSTEE